MIDFKKTQPNADELAAEIKRDISLLQDMGRDDLLLRAIGVPVLERLRIEAARGMLSHLEVTADYRFILTDYHKTVDLSPIHKAVYLLFLNHPEGIEFKHLNDYRYELYNLYKETANRIDMAKVEQTVDRLVNPFDNAINEKCSRIKEAFLSLMDEYSASYYIISNNTMKHSVGSTRVWYERLKVITLPRNLVILPPTLQSYCR